MDPIEEEAAIAEERASERPMMTHDVLEEPISELCHKDAVSIPVGATIGDAVRTMQEQGIGSVLVVDGDTLACIVTERDVLMKVVGKDLAVLDTPVRDFMTP
ncbi:MAG: CBS domain-containing protein, partial [Deltaproteobacteria bacterium]|nr:CBS domain-containing protein [Deltaproteobacteria bacterium]